MMIMTDCIHVNLFPRFIELMGDIAVQRFPDLYVIMAEHNHVYWKLYNEWWCIISVIPQ